MTNAWFTRRWVIQELALAKEGTLRSGKYAASWDNFATTIAFYVFVFPRIRQLSKSLATGVGIKRLGPVLLAELIDNLLRIDEGKNIAEYRMTLEDLVTNLKAYEATDPRDIITLFYHQQKIPRGKEEVLHDSRL